MHRHLEHDRLASQLSDLIVFRESDVDVFCFLFGHADQLIFEARDECAGTDLQRIRLSLSAVESDTVLESFKIDDCRISALHIAFFFNDHIGITLLQALDLCIDVLLRYARSLLLDRKALVIAKLDFRLDRTDELQDDFFLVDLIDAQFRAVHQHELVFFHTVTEHIIRYCLYSIH